jgi:hypothetical protein
MSQPRITCRPGLRVEAPSRNQPATVLQVLACGFMILTITYFFYEAL